MTRQTDDMDVARANALAATLGLKQRFEQGSVLPPFFHHIYFWDAQPADALGLDGHPKLGTGLIPDMGLPRRMWAGGALDCHAPLRAGVIAEKRSRCIETTRKTGRTGPLAFVTLEHEVFQNDRLCVRETQNLVYRSAENAQAGTSEFCKMEPDRRRACTFDETHLFRFSALTFNGHRIHYDLAHTRDVEGFTGLVVHGPLLALLLMMFAREHLGELRNFTFRNAAPLLVDETAYLCVSDDMLWIEDQSRRVIMRASVKIR